jgi:hypothetical protein
MFTRPLSPDSTTPGTPPEDLDDLLSDPHCEHLLEFLWRTEGPVPLATASRYIVGRITGTSVTQVPENVQRRVQTWLHHGLLPALAAHGIIVFDAEEGTVELTEDTVVPLLLSEDGTRGDEPSDRDTDESPDHDGQ